LLARDTYLSQFGRLTLSSVSSPIYSKIPI
jgi:hypothetical protein